MATVSKDKRNFRVFICSTWEDLEKERSQVLEAVRQLRFQHVAMEYFGADPRRPIEVCLEQVQRSDVFVGIVGHRYGSIVEETGKSYTHMEYDEATRIGLPRLIYLRNDDVPILPRFMERNPESLMKLDEFKATLQRQHTPYYFRDGSDLAVRVVADLSSFTEGLTYQEQFKTHVGSLRTQIINLIDSALTETHGSEAFLKDLLGYVETSYRRQTSALVSLFLSYTHSDRAFARRLATDLVSAGIKVWMDEGEIKPGDSLVKTLSSAIDKMDFFAVLLSPSSVASDWVKRELNAALYKELHTRRIKIIPILIADCEIPAILRDRLYLDMRNEDEYVIALRELLKTLHEIR
jgi:hypothetical protein